MYGGGGRGLIFFIMFYDGLSGEFILHLQFVNSCVYTLQNVSGVGRDLSKSNPHLWSENKAHVTFSFSLDFFTSESIESIRLLGD